jgi:hypothetical protein
VFYLTIPRSVEFLLQLDDPAVWEEAYPGCTYIGDDKRGRAAYEMPRAALTKMVSDVRYLAKHGTEGSLGQRSGALRWADRVVRDELPKL